MSPISPISPCPTTAPPAATQLCTGPLPTARLSRRHFLNQFGLGLGGMALAHLLSPARAFAANQVGTTSTSSHSRVFAAATPSHNGILTTPHFPPKAKRIIYLFMAGGPSQLETF